MFEDRIDAGRKLAEELVFLKEQNCIVLGVPRGGAVVAYEVAKVIGAPLDIVIPRKIGAPHNPEVAVGAAAEDGTVIWDEYLMELLGISSDHMEKTVQREVEEIKRRRKAYRGDKPEPDTQGKTVVIVDDGIATGFTVMAAIKSIYKNKPKSIILAVPVMPPDTFERFEGVVEKIVCLETPEEFYAVGQFYRDFGQASDEEVVELLRR